MSAPTVIVHELKNEWYRALRPRLIGLPARWVETRSLADLGAALRGLACPVVLISAGPSPENALQAIVAARTAAPDGLILVHDRSNRHGLASIARELGAARVIGGEIPPPEVAAIVGRWIALATERIRRSGWCAEVELSRVETPSRSL